VSGPSTAAPDELELDNRANHVHAAEPSERARDPQREAAANDNTSTPPVVVLHAIGDGALLYRTLARVLVGAALRDAIPLAAPDDSDSF
jgi:hypothetical protein